MNTTDQDDLIRAISGLGDRIAKIADLLGGKKNLAKAIGISESQLYRYISGDSQPTVEPLAAIAKSGNVHLDWLVLGEGPTGLLHSVNDIKAVYNPQKQYVYIEEYGDPDDPLDNLPATAAAKISFNLLWLAKHELPSQNLRLIRAHGDSMAPTIENGDILLVDISQRQFSGDGVYLLDMQSNSLIAKRLQRTIDKGLMLINDNSAYADQQIGNDDQPLTIIGKIVWVAGLV